MTVVFHLIGLVIGPAGIIHHHDESAVNRSAHYLVIECLRGVGLGSTERTAILILEGIGELLGRLAYRHRNHLIDLTEHTGLCLIDSSLFLAFGYHLAQLEPILTELG